MKIEMIAGGTGVMFTNLNPAVINDLDCVHLDRKLRRDLVRQSAIPNQ